MTNIPGMVTKTKRRTPYITPFLARAPVSDPFTISNTPAAANVKDEQVEKEQVHDGTIHCPHATGFYNFIRGYNHRQCAEYHQQKRRTKPPALPATGMFFIFMYPVLFSGK